MKARPVLNVVGRVLVGAALGAGLGAYFGYEVLSRSVDFRSQPLRGVGAGAHFVYLWIGVGFVLLTVGVIGAVARSTLVGEICGLVLGVLVGVFVAGHDLMKFVGEHHAAWVVTGAALLTALVGTIAGAIFTRWHPFSRRRQVEIGVSALIVFASAGWWLFGVDDWAMRSLKSDSVRERRWGASRLNRRVRRGDVESEVVVSRLLEAMSDSDPVVRSSAASVLTKFGEDPARIAALEEEAGRAERPAEEVGYVDDVQAVFLDRLRKREDLQRHFGDLVEISEGTLRANVEGLVASRSARFEKHPQPVRVQITIRRPGRYRTAFSGVEVVSVVRRTTPDNGHVIEVEARHPQLE